MDPISFRCTTCDHLLKVAADRAGRKVKCNRCNAILTVPEANGKADDEVADAAPAAPPKRHTFEGEEEDDGKGYGFLIDPKEEEARKRREEEERRAKKKKKDEPVAAIKKRVKTIYDVDDWKKIRVGLVIMLAALAFWGLQLILHQVVVLVGLLRGPEYNILVERVLFQELENPADWPKVGRTMPMDRMAFSISLVSGYNSRTLGKVFVVLGEAFLVVTWGMLLASYFFFKNIPSRFGTKQLVTGMIVLNIINLTFLLLGRLLPAATGFGPALIPLVAPEVPLNAANVERSLPLHVFWMHSPLWETMLTLLVQLCFWVELILVGVFLWQAGRIIKEDQIQEYGHGMCELAGGVYFIGFAYIMISLAGTSVVLITVLMVVYVLWVCFTLGYLIRFAVVLNNIRLILDKLITDTEAEERRTGKKKRTRKAREDDDEYDEDDEDDYDDEEDEDDDRRRRRRDDDEDDED